MTDELFGKAAVEQSQGYEPLHPPQPPAPERDEAPTFGPGEDGLRDAANALTSARKQQAADEPHKPVERAYRAADGELAHKKSVSLDDAARDLTDVHRAETLAQSFQEANELAGAIDCLRSAVNGDRAADHADLSQPQPEAPPPEPPIPGIDPEIQQALQNPKVRAALETEARAIESARQSYTQATGQAAQAAVAGMFASFPELASLNAQQLPVALQIMQQQNPQRFAEVQGHLGRVQSLYNANLQAQAQQQQVQQAQWQRYVADEDRKFDEYVANEPRLKNQNPGEVADHAIKLLTETYGIPKAELAHLWNSHPVMRSSAAQRLIMDATLFHMAKANVSRPDPREIPPVQRPGTRNVPHVDAHAVEAAAAKFAREKSPKAALELVKAQRAMRQAGA